MKNKKWFVVLDGSWTYMTQDESDTNDVADGTEVIEGQSFSDAKKQAMAYFKERIENDRRTLRNMRKWKKKASIG